MPNSIFTLYDSNLKHTPDDLLSAILGNIGGISLVANSVKYIGSDNATSMFSGFNFGGTVKMDKSGILLTSGDGAPALNNTESSYTQGNASAGDSEFDALAEKAFEQAGKTYDAAILEFSFTVTNPKIKSVSFDIIFGSEEYPQYIDTSYVDIAAVLVNGTNYGLFDGDPQKPLSIVGNSVHSGSFFDNQLEADEIISLYSIEYNGISPLMTVQIPLDGSDVYNVRLGIADTGDYAWDSGLFISNFSTGISNAGGLLVKVEAAPDGDILEPAGPDTATFFVGGAGDDTMTGSTAADIYDIQAGGNNVIQGTLGQLNNDTVLGFGDGDTLSFLGASFNADALTITMGSAILDIDADGDGEIDSTVKLEGDYEGAEFFVTQTEAGSEITVQMNTEPEASKQEIQLTELYMGFFGRAVEYHGLEYHKQKLDARLKSGLTEDEALLETAEDFWFDAKKFPITGYTEEMSNLDFVTKVYSNVLGRPDALENDADGINYWVDEMNQDGISHAKMVLMIIKGAHAYNEENNDEIAQYVSALLDNRTDVSLYFAQEKISGDLYDNAAIQMGIDVINRIDQNKSSVANVINALDNNTLYDLPEIELVGTGTSPAIFDDFIM